MQMMKTKTLAAALCFAAVGLVSCKQGGEDMLVTDLKIADQNIPGTYASQVDDSVAMKMTVYEYVLNEDGTGNYQYVRPGANGSIENYTEDFTWKRGELSKDLLSIPITLSPMNKVLTWTNGSIVDDVTVCNESAKATNYGKVLSALPNTKWIASDSTWFIHMLQLDSMSYAWKNQRDTLNQLEIDAENLYLAAHADEIRAALGMKPTDPVEVSVLKDLGDGTFQVIFPHYVGTRVEYEYPDTLGLKTELFTTVSFLNAGGKSTGNYVYQYAEYKLNADSTEIIPVKNEVVLESYNWYVSKIVNAKKFDVKAVANDTVMLFQLSAFDGAKGTMDMKGITYKKYAQ